MKVAQWIEENDAQLTRLHQHFIDHGSPNFTKEDLVSEMLEDVFDLWLESHEKGAKCEAH